MEEALVGGDIQKEIFIKRKDPDKGFVFIKTDSNLGFSGGNNVGAKYAVLSGYDYVLLLNNDTVIIDKDFLKKLITPFETDERAFLTGPNIINFDATFDSPMVEDTFMSNLLYLPLRNILRRKLDCPSAYIDIKAISSPKPVPVFKISGACMMFKSDKLVDIEYLDENVWLSSEEAILSEKIKNKDGKIIFQPLTTLIHKKAKTPRPKSDKYSILKNHYKQRDYFNRNYRNYSALQLSLIGLMNKIRLILIRIGR
jgi:GT2 family glycosyltransferase